MLTSVYTRNLMHLVRVEVSERKETATSRLKVQLVQVDTLGRLGYSGDTIAQLVLGEKEK